MNFQDVMQLFINLIAGGMKLLYIVAFAAFFWGIVLFIINTDDDKKRSEGKEWMKWSVIALFVMITVWGIVAILVNTFGISPLIIPQLPGT